MTGGRIVVIGPTGRNFGAGMSGGVAYVYDPAGDLAIRVNKEMVELEPLVDDEDLDLVRGLLDRHLGYTGSTVAAGLLENWPTVAGKFVKVMPVEYKRALREQREEQERATGVAEGVGADGG